MLSSVATISSSAGKVTSVPSWNGSGLMPSDAERMNSAPGGPPCSQSVALWQVASLIFALLVQRLDYAAVYGPVGAVVALLSWVYLSSFIALFGAHLSAQMHQKKPGSA